MDWFPPRQVTVVIASALLLLANFPARAADPFRIGKNTRPIGPETETAFNSIFKQGDYLAAKRHLEQALQSSAETNDPLTYSLLASLAFMERNWVSFSRYADQTQETAKRLTAKDPLRGNLYQAVGYFLEASFDVSPAGDGLVRGTPKALSKVQQMLKALDQAVAVDPHDPELNLVKGFMDLMLASDLALLSPAQAIQRLEDYAAPEYLAQRGIAIAYRDMKQPAKALNAVNKALQAAPENPELFYLKAQILHLQGKTSESVTLFDQALAKQNQLPPSLVQQITRERNRT